MKIALAQVNPTVGDFTGNTRKLSEFYAKAGAGGANLVVFPELAVCGYPPADLLEKTSFLDQANATIGELARLTAAEGAPAMLVGTVMRAEVSPGKQVRNVAALLAGGRVRFVQQKMLLPYYDVFDEQRYFEPAEQQELTILQGQPLAITVCEDAWNDKGFWPRQLYPVDPVEALMQQWRTLPAGLDQRPRVLLNISASPYWQGKREVRREMLAALAKRHGTIVAMVNQVGGNDSLVFDGASLVVGRDGGVQQQAASFAEDLIYFDTDAEVARPLEQRNQTLTSGHRPLVSQDQPPIPKTKIGEVAHDGRADIAGTWDALVLGVRDYLGKCGFKQALVGLSGGIDSALVAAIAVEALGADNVRGIGMPGEYSSAGSIDDADRLARNLGIRYEKIPIHGVFAGFEQALEPFFRGTAFGLAEENLQSRIRGALLMSFSNKFGALVLTTGNKSEMSTGYCTLYGDMVGALAVIGDVSKTRVYQLAWYANREREVIPQATIAKAPSAELRPDQKDTDSLPSYDVLDPILEAYVERYSSPEQISEEQGVELELVKSVVKMVERAEYKRQQAAPVLKVTKKSFGTGRRFPIAVRH